MQGREEASSSSKQNIALKCNDQKMIKENGKKIESSSNSSEERDENDDDGEEEEEGQYELLLLLKKKMSVLFLLHPMKMKKIWNLYRRFQRVVNNIRSKDMPIIIIEDTIPTNQKKTK